MKFEVTAYFRYVKIVSNKKISSISLKIIGNSVIYMNLYKYIVVKSYVPRIEKKQP